MGSGRTGNWLEQHDLCFTSLLSSAHQLLEAFGLLEIRDQAATFVQVETLTLFFSQAAAFSGHKDKACERDDDEQARRSN